MAFFGAEIPTTPMFWKRQTTQLEWIVRQMSWRPPWLFDDGLEATAAPACFGHVNASATVPSPRSPHACRASSPAPVSPTPTPRRMTSNLVVPPCFRVRLKLLAFCGQCRPVRACCFRSQLAHASCSETRGRLRLRPQPRVLVHAELSLQLPVRDPSFPGDRGGVATRRCRSATSTTSVVLG